MSWSSQRPIFNRLPAEYRNSAPADWFTVPWDELLISSKLQGDNFYTNFLNPVSAQAAVLDWLGQFCGFTGEYWESSWAESIKRTLIAESYTRIWPGKGSRDLLDWLIGDAFSLQAAIYIPNEFLADVSRAGDTLGAETGLIYYIRAPLQYARNSNEWLTLENLNRLYGPVYAKSRIVYDQFYADVSQAGDPVFDSPLFDDLAEDLTAPFTVPTGLVVTRQGSAYSTNLDPTSFEFSTDHTYYVEKSGDNANDGSQSSPFLTVRHALETLESSVHTSATILVGVGTYENDWINTRTSKDVVIKALDTTFPIFRIASFQTWTNVSGNVWSAQKGTSPPLTHAYDLARSNSAIVPTMVSSVAEVTATAGTQFLDPVDDTLYVHLLDGRQPDGNVKASFAIEAGGFGDDRSAIDGTNLQLYVENLIFEGGNLGFTINGTGQNATVVNCTFRYSGGDGFSTLPPDETVSTSGTLRLFNCTASYNLGNGFDLGSDISGLTVITEGCVAEGCRTAGMRFSNVTAIDVGGAYTNASADNLTLLNAATGWVVGAIAQNAGGRDLFVESGASGWFYGCNTIGSSATYGIEAESGATAVLQERNLIHTVLIN